MHAKDGVRRLHMETTLAVLGDGGRSVTELDDATTLPN